jgi:hypothetical protein
MIGTDMALKGLMFAEGLVTWRISRASESLMAFMCLYMSSESSRCQKAFRTSFLIALI